MLPGTVKIVEVGARDGLQNESRALPVAVRVELIRLLAAAGLTAIEAGAFVSNKRVAQMAGSGEVLRALLDDADDGNTVTDDSTAPNSVSYPVLVPNMRGLEDALAAARGKSRYSPRPQKNSAGATSTAASMRASSDSPALPSAR